MKRFFLCIMFTLSAHASLFSLEGNKVKFQSSEFMVSALVKSYADLNKLNLVFDSEFKDTKMLLAGPKEIDRESLELYLSTILLQAGYGMRILPETTTLSIFNGRDVRYLITTTHKDLSTVPDTYEHVQFMYELKHLPSDSLARNLRPFISRYGRIIDHTNSILLADTGKNVRRIMKIIQELDTPQYLKSAEEVKKLNERNQKIISKQKGLLEILNDNSIIFLILFALIGGIIGFGVRGYAMKRIEGGW